MDTTFRFSSAQEISEEFIEKLKNFYKGKPISITVTEDFQTPDWQKEDSRLQKKFYSLDEAKTETKKRLTELCRKDNLL